MNNGYLVSGSDDQSIIVWNYDLGSQIRLIENAHSNLIQCLKVLKNGNIASGGDDQIVKIWDSTTYALLTTLPGHTSSVSVLEVLSNGLLASGSSDKSMRYWNTTSGQEMQNTSPLSAAITCLKQMSSSVIFIGGNTRTMAFSDGTSTLTRSEAIQASSCSGFSIYNNQFMAVAQPSTEVDIYDVSSPTNPVRLFILDLAKESNCVESLRM